MGTWTVLACATVIFMSLYSSQDFATRLNFKIAPHIEFQIIAVIGIIVNFIFCYVWEVSYLGKGSFEKKKLRIFSTGGGVRTKVEKILIFSVAIAT